MIDSRQYLRSKFAHPEQVRVLAPWGERQLGYLEDASLGGFKAQLRHPLSLGDLLEGVIEFPGPAGIPHWVPFQARCRWVRGHAHGFALRELPLASERDYDWLTENAEAI